LTVTVGASVPTGPYTLTVTGAGSSATHTTTVTLTVTTPGIVNGGFETGSLAGWTRSGAVTGVTTSRHSGSYAAVGGSSAGPTNGDSSIAQTFTAPSGATSLSFWYQVHCPDDVSYDWATATLRDNTASTTTTPLAPTCTNTATWVQVTAAVTPGHSYTLTLTSHDDNYTGDQTYTLYDDIVVL
jgi:hypothetical protein